MILIPFTNTQNEGWAIFEALGSVQNAKGDRPYQLQKIDDEDRFEDDTDAWRFVWKRAAEGSALHIAALDYLKTHSPAEYAAIAAECSDA